MYRGQIPFSQIASSAHLIENKRIVHFADGIPTRFNCRLNKQPPVVVPGGEIAKHESAVCMAANSTVISEVFSRIDWKFNCMYAKRAFVHWYLREGMEEEEFTEAQADLAELEREYEEINEDE